MIKSFEILFLCPTCKDKTLLKHVEISLSLIHCLINFDHHVRVFRIAHVGENNIEREEEKKTKYQFNDDMHGVNFSLSAVFFI